VPVKLTITTTKPSDSEALWPFELDRDDLNQGNTNLHEEWVSQQPGFIDRASAWVTPGYVYEKIYIFDTQENCDAFLENRKDESTQHKKIEYFKENGFVSHFETTEI